MENNYAICLTHEEAEEYRRLKAIKRGGDAAVQAGHDLDDLGAQHTKAAGPARRNKAVAVIGGQDRADRFIGEEAVRAGFDEYDNLSF